MSRSGTALTSPRADDGSRQYQELWAEPNQFELASYRALVGNCGQDSRRCCAASYGWRRVLQGRARTRGWSTSARGGGRGQVESTTTEAVEPSGRSDGARNLRDIVAMGARTIALLDGCARCRVAIRARGSGLAIRDCVRVHTVGGDTVFDEAYRDNCLGTRVRRAPAAEASVGARPGTGNLASLRRRDGRDGRRPACSPAGDRRGRCGSDPRPRSATLQRKKMIEVAASRRARTWCVSCRMRCSPG